MPCHKLNEKNGVDTDKFEDYNNEIMIPKHLVEEFKQFEIPTKSNSEEVRIVYHEMMNASKKSKLVHS